MFHPPSSQHRRRSKPFTRLRRSRGNRPLVAILTALALAVGGQLSAVVGATPATAASNAPTSHACPKLSATRHLTCFALKRTDKKPLSQKARPLSVPSGYGYGPSQLQAAYNLASAAASNGGNSTVAVVDAYDYGNAASDLAAYRSAAGLPAANFTKVNQNGQASPLPSAPPAGDDWTVEEALDLDMVSAICPNCKIVLVEANDDQSDGLFVAENTAASLAGYISNSWGESEVSNQTSLDSQYFNHPGTVMTASSGDNGYGVIYPASSSNVVAVGGTSLSSASNARGWSESVWSGAGSGCSSYDPKPSWQTDTGCSNRTVADVAADADPATGVAVYDTSNGNGGWTEVGGTSASSPMIAAVYALAGNAGNNPAQSLYTNASALNDVTSGANGTCSPDDYLCTGEPGYDGPTGNGTPNGLGAFGGS
jgi:subtilase family serine protease